MENRSKVAFIYKEDVKNVLSYLYSLGYEFSTGFPLEAYFNNSDYICDMAYIVNENDKLIYRNSGVYNNRYFNEYYNVRKDEYVIDPDFFFGYKKKSKTKYIIGSCLLIVGIVAWKFK